MKFDTQKYSYPSRRTVSFAKNGMVATSSPLPAQVGLDVLKKGGNAIDAAVATAAALSVIEPTSNGIGADSFALNGAFLGYGVDYANLGRETADMIASILTEGKDPATTPVITFDNGTATVNTEICEKLGLDFDTVSEAFAPYCTRVEEITTAESFSDLES